MWQSKRSGQSNYRCLIWTLLLATACSAGCQRSANPIANPVGTNVESIGSPEDAGSELQPATETRLASATSSTKGRELFLRHCAACHGEQGDGRGLAATFLFPKPRNFQIGKYRLVSTVKPVPTREDLDAVLVRGMPGSSMPPWEHLSKVDRDALIDEVIRLTREGLRQRYVKILKDDDDSLTDEQIAEDDSLQEEIREFVESGTTPGPVTEVPLIGEPKDSALAHGKEVYTRQGCNSCHGNEGRGDGVQRQFDVEGFPTRPRDYTRGIFKGGHDAASLYRRIAYGMPGTPMPSSGNLQPADIVDLVHFLRSMSTEEQRQATILKREKIVATRVSVVPKSAEDDRWSGVSAANLRMTPLWWRDDADPGLSVQATHDGKTLALRLSWNDATFNDRAIHSEQFEDMVAAEFCPANSEPFLGMGATDTVVDLWHWRAGLAHSGAEDQLLDEYPFDTDTYRELAKGKPLPDFVTARAAGNPLSKRQHSGANLAAKGFGSTTFRPPASQLVRAGGAWKNGRWTVVMSRPLAIADGEGLALTAGGHYAVAFAVWDGAFRDRAAQKVISIWNDLRIEE